ncbi:hypothetical protein J4526_02165 [Desulfurococcaceae archaeon MEX13E-LK6-19]|nr:hypothetical protein J4526_02165 [Desulfurococcaceae archaeon MEX13E-LK6-19]
MLYTMTLNKQVKLVIAGFVFMLSTLFTLAIYLRYELVYGIDGPYYIIQYYSILHSGTIKYPDPPLAFYILYPFQRLTDLLYSDPGLGLKICVSLFTGLTSVIIFATLLEVYKKINLLYIVLLSLFFSLWPQTLRIETDFVKNSIGLLFLAMYIYSLVTRNFNTKIRTIILLISITLSCLTHILVFGTIVLITLIYISCFIITRKDVTILVKERLLLISLMTVITLFIVILLYPPIVGGDSIKVIYFMKSLLSSISRASSEFQLNTPRLKKPAPFYAGLDPIAYLMFIYFNTIMALIVFIKQRNYMFLSLTMCLAFMNIPIIPSNWLMRLMLMSGFLLPYVLSWTHILRVKHRYVALLLFYTTLLVGLTTTIPRIGPSIPPGAYEELKQLDNVITKGSNVFVPDIRIRYWFEALHYGEYNIITINDVKSGIKPDYIILDRIRAPRPPPRAVIVYKGFFITVYKIL